MLDDTAWRRMFDASLAEADPAIEALIRQEGSRNNATVNLVASESYCPRATLEAEASILVSKNITGYPDSRAVGGCEHVNSIERLAQQRACALFSAQHANVQALSSTIGNIAVLRGLLKPNDRILSLGESAGGHHSHGARYHLSGHDYQVARFGVDEARGGIDLDVVRDRARSLRPRMIIAGSTALPRAIDFVGLRAVRPGTFERWGLGYAALSAINPRLILVRVSGFGQTGPYAHRGGYGTIAEAFSGIPSFTGFPHRPPTLPGFPMADSVASTFAAMAAMFAVYRRDQGGSGRGQEVDVSLYEPLFRLAEAQVIGFDQLGIVKRRQGNRLAEDSPRNTFRTVDDRRVGISASSPRNFLRLCQALGRPELVDDLRYATNVSRCEHADALDALIAEWFSTRTLSEVMTLFDAAGVVGGPVLTIADIAQDPHYQAREDIVSVPDEHFGTVRMQGVTPRFVETPGKVRHSGRNVGADTVAILGGQLGLDIAEIDRLTGPGAI